ncbi:MAG: DUF3108 domain-containing protein [Calditrichaeota bacterium]|nr:DUF3108 domain-containing protein [Calditrichota bacterium]
MRVLITLLILGMWLPRFGLCGESIDIPTWRPFGVGESLEYNVRYGVIPAGKARIAILDTMTVRNKLCFHAVSQARSAKAFDVVFKVRDNVETWFDYDSLYTHRFRKRLHEGRYRDDKIVDYRYGEGIARLNDDGEHKGDYPIPAWVQDALSALFWVRTLPFREDTTLVIPTHDINKTYNLQVVIGPKETVSTPAGDFECYQVEPRLESGGIFKKDKGARIWIWFTADERKLPVLMKSKVFFGHVTAELESYTPGAP